jgi:uncharacterized protein YdaU (DUF1376 family)
MADNQPFLPFFVGDFLGATVLWEGEERALYMLMLAYQWSGGALPADLEKLSRALAYPHKKFMSLWLRVGTKFTVNGSVLLNERLELHRAKTVELSAARANAGSVGGKASAAKRAAQAGAKNGAKVPAKPVAPTQANTQATVEANAQANDVARGIQKATILSDPIHPNPIRSDPCADPEQFAHDEVPGGNEGKPDAGLPPNGAGRGNGGQPNGAEDFIDNSYPYEQTIMAKMPKAPNPPNWPAAMANARTLVQLGLATWPELAQAAERYAKYFGSGAASVNVAAHNFFDRTKGNHWQQAWTVEPLPTKSESRQATNIEAGLKFLAAGSTEP